MEKVITIGHAISYDNFFRDRSERKSKDFLILSRISRIKNIDESVQGFLNSSYGKIQTIKILTMTLKQLINIIKMIEVVEDKDFQRMSK